MIDTLLHNPPRMRGIKQTITELRQIDPNTALTEKALRRLVITGVIPSVRIGRKYLINFDTLQEFLRGGISTVTPAAPAEDYGKIRVVGGVR